MARYLDIIVRISDAQARAALGQLATESETSAERMSRAYDRTSRRITNIGSALQTVGRNMTMFAGGMALAGGYAVKQSMNFQTAMMRIHTQAGATLPQVNALSKAVLNLGGSGSAPYGPTQLAEALYHIESVSTGTYPALRQTGNAMQVLKIASQGAAVGGSDLSDTTSALIGLMTATHAPISAASRVMGELNAAVGIGNMTMTELVTALGRGVVPAFQSVGLTSQDALAALALFSDQGTKASSAAAQMGTALHYLVSPSKAADKALFGLGLSQNTLAEQLQKPQGLYRALLYLKDGLSKLPGGLKNIQAEQTLYTLLPGGRGRILIQALNNLDQLKGKTNALYGSTNTTHAAYKAWAGTLSGQFHQAWAKIQADIVKFGNGLIPIISKSLPGFLNAITNVVRWFSNLSPTIKSAVYHLTIFAALGGPLVTLVGKIMGVWSAMRRVKAMIMDARHAFFLMRDAEGAAGTVAKGLATTLGRIAPLAAIMEALNSAGKYNQAVKQNNVGRQVVQGGLLGASGGVLGMVGYGALTGSEAGPLGLLAGAGAGLVAGGGAALVKALFGGSTGGLVTTRGIKRYQTGGFVDWGTDSVPAMLTPGEFVMNRAATSSLGLASLMAMNGGRGMGSSGGGNITITPAPVTLVLDGRVLARSVIQYSLQRAARGPSSLVGGSLVTGATAYGTS